MVIYLIEGAKMGICFVEDVKKVMMLEMTKVIPEDVKLLNLQDNNYSHSRKIERAA